MNFCQKHANHHCIHAHTCKQHTHQPKKQPSTHKKVVNPSHGPQLHRPCIFEGSTYNKQCQVAVGKLSQQGPKAKLTNQEATISALQSKNQALTSENTHFKAQIQYYREQFLGIIQRNTVDMREQIKRNLKMVSDLQLRVSSLICENNSLKQENQQLKQIIHDNKAQKQSFRQATSKFEQKYNVLCQSLKVSQKQRERLQKLLDSKYKEEGRTGQRHQILKRQLTFENDKKQIQIVSLEAELKASRSELLKVQSEYKKLSAITQLERTHSEQKISILEKKMIQEQQKNQKLTENLNEMTKKYQQLTDDLAHTKAILQKQLQLKADSKSFAQKLDSSKDNTQKVLLQVCINKQEKQKQRQDSSQNKKLREQIKVLSQQIQRLESNKKANIEEIVLQMGASEAFQKLLEEKNRVIKKLIKEKGQIYTLVSSRM